MERLELLVGQIRDVLRVAAGVDTVSNGVLTIVHLSY